MTKDDLVKLLGQSYRQGFEDAIKCLVEAAKGIQFPPLEEQPSNKLED